MFYKLLADARNNVCAARKNAFIEVTAEPAVAAGARSQPAPPLRARCRLGQPPAESQLGAQAGDATPLGAATQLARAPDDQKTFDEIKGLAQPGRESQAQLELGGKKADRLGITSEAAASSEGMGPEPADAPEPVGQKRGTAEVCPFAALSEEALACEGGGTTSEGERLALGHLDDDDRQAHADFLSALQPKSSRIGRDCLVTNVCCVQ